MRFEERIKKTDLTSFQYLNSFLGKEKAANISVNAIHPRHKWFSPEACITERHQQKNNNKSHYGDIFSARLLDQHLTGKPRNSKIDKYCTHLRYIKLDFLFLICIFPFSIFVSKVELESNANTNFGNKANSDTGNICNQTCFSFTVA